MTLITWSWIFLVLYIGAMIGIGLFAQRKIQHADDFATARGGYGPFFLALAFAASTAAVQPFSAARHCPTNGDSRPTGVIFYTRWVCTAAF